MLKIFSHHTRKTKNQRGVAVILASLLVSAVLAATIGITSSLILLLQISGRVVDSVSAFYAADTGVEWELYSLRIGTTSAPVMANGATYVTNFTPSATGTPNVIKSIGVFKRTSRGLEAIFD
jgi:hypothetical protein